MPDLELRQMRACYYGMINEVDDAVGRLIAHLKETGEYDSTLIVFTCDHGEMGGDHYTWGKELYFDPSFHIPLIIRDPRREADAGRGRQVDEFTESVDIMPTILDWLGLEAPVECDGSSLLPFIEGETPETWRREAHVELDFRTTPNLGGFDAETALGLAPDECQLAILRGRKWKYVHFTALPPLLFDLESDPDEMDNLAEDPAYAGLVRDCAQRLLSKRMRHAERTLTNLHLWREGVLDRRAIAR
jgi:arylsulfatase A-like enzyme